MLAFYSNGFVHLVYEWQKKKKTKIMIYNMIDDSCRSFPLDSGDINVRT